MKWSNLRIFVCLVSALAVFGAKDHKAPDQVQAVILDQNSYPCVNCLFGVSQHYFCFNANNKILIGRDDVRTQMRKKTPTELMERGKTVAIRFDDRYIWTAGPNGKDIRMTQDYTKKIFLNDPRCLSAVK